MSSKPVIGVGMTKWPFEKNAQKISTHEVKNFSTILGHSSEASHPSQSDELHIHQSNVKTSIMICEG